MRHGILKIAALAALLAGLVLAGCAANQRPMTLKEFYGFCWPSQINVCMDDYLCDDYRDWLAQDHASKQECLKGCNQMQMHKIQNDTLKGCTFAIRGATDLCEQYCRRFFDYGPSAAQPPAQPAGPMQQKDWG